MRRAALALVVLVAGCGGGHPERSKPVTAKEGGEEAEREEAARGLPAADRVAYYQLATGIGTLRARASVVALGRPGAQGANATLEATISRLRRLRPHDGTLMQLRTQTLDAARAAVRTPLTGTPAKQAARRQLAAADRLRASLDQLVRSDPRFSALVPD